MNKERIARLNALQQSILNTNIDLYMYLDGVITEEDYLPIKKQRMEWMKEIRNINYEGGLNHTNLDI